MQSDRVVEITFGKLSAGSGYLITPRHALTARHVCEPEQVGAACQVRPLASADDALKPVSERVRPDAVGGRVGWLSAAQDVAVIDLDAPVMVGSFPGQAGPGQPIPFGIVPYDQTSHVCDGTGFPEASGTEDRTLDATLVWVMASRRFDVNVRNGPPRSYKLWAGFSGTLLFAGGVPVGVICTVDGKWDGGVLEATPLEVLLDDPGFIAHLAAAQVAAPERRVIGRLASTLLARISARVYRIDRNEQAEAIIGHVRRLPERAPPQVFVIPGLDEDEHRLLIDRLSREPVIGRRLGREADGENVIRSLPWPKERSINPDARFHDTLLDRFHAALGLPPPTPGAPPDLAGLRRRLNDGVAPRGFWVLVNRADAFAGHAALLRQWLGLWDSLAKLEPGPPVLLFLCLAWDDPPPEKPSLIPFLRRPQPKPDPDLEAALAEAFERGQLTPLDDLRKITAADVHPWIDELRHVCQPAPAEHFEVLRFSLLNRIGDGKRMRGLSTDISALLERLDPLPGAPR
ncbi:hypothetical protein [Limobrevibacterium gyesilva]|uniref:Inactive STAND domain-containing protein n=1 Tax=Limobrevibacterium gyesilva TaxID=2991712 RepID=A0AA42CGN9_9PROT|nr:hypothetical protein [Limobrevibacterium gyesilva]MCW3474182.1 hypothetical protein [Limobrevibacterium gyesilva]